MKLKFNYKKHILHFKFEAGTSRGKMTQRATYYLFLEDSEGRIGTGESSPLSGLSIDDVEDFEWHLQRIGEQFLEIPEISQQEEVYQIVAELVPSKFPSIRMGFETALCDLYNGGNKVIFNNTFHLGTQKLPINGLVWMGDAKFMEDQVEEKLAQGFNCIKIKIGAIDLGQELGLLKSIRRRFGPDEITLRVDANGAFTYLQARKVLSELNDLAVHSIEQPVKAGQVDIMAKLCKEKLLPIALDEELIGKNSSEEKIGLLKKIQPDFIILKPTLLGGFSATSEWIAIARELNIGWWVTSALESNIGLNAICQFTAGFENLVPQGLGTGKLYTNNIDSPLMIENGHIFWSDKRIWTTPNENSLI